MGEIEKNQAPLDGSLSDRSAEDRVVGGVALNNLSGRQVGRYLVQRQLGSGGVAVVYQAYDQVQGISVALKVLLLAPMKKRTAVFAARP